MDPTATVCRKNVGLAKFFHACSALMLERTPKARLGEIDILCDGSHFLLFGYANQFSRKSVWM
jgi:hypothetical protein